MVLVKEEMRKGSWTEQEDLQLVRYVGLFGERRWDFIAEVSGLNRTGKSCRLRWLNYLHPGLKRGRLTPQEERLILELHSLWGNRWSRIARRLPGRTDNEIKNYWRTHMRRRAQEQKRNYSSEPPQKVTLESHESSSTAFEKVEDGLKGYSMDEIWDEIDTSESGSGLSYEECKDEASNAYCCSSAISPLWDNYSFDALWKTDDDQFVSLLPSTCDFIVPIYEHTVEYSCCQD